MKFKETMLFLLLNSITIFGGFMHKKEYISWEDRLAALYNEYAMKCGNKFVADWFELNLNINNVLTAITCRKYGFDKANYIVGHNEIAENIPHGKTVPILEEMCKWGEENRII